MIALIESLIEKKESLFLEFKSQWYWNNSDKDISKNWGEFLKDFVALINCSPEYINEEKYLIIGIEEEQEGINKIKDISFDSNGEEIRKLKNIDDFKCEIILKLNNNFKKSDDTLIEDMDFKLQYFTIKNNKILVFIIKPISQIVILNKDLQDKKTTTRRNSVFIRTLKENGEPQVDIADPETIEELKKEFKKYKQEKELEIKKEISIEKTINLFIQNNNAFTLETPVKEKNWKSNILFEVFPLKSTVAGDIDFIYIYEKSSQQKTYDYLIKEKLLTKDSKRIVLISKELKKENLQRIFSTNEVYFIEEFGYKHLYHSYFQEEIFHEGNFNIINYIEPFTKNSKEKTAYNILHEWFEKIANPLIVVKGYGGIGKTTLVKYFLDKAINYKENNVNVLFINSNEILNDIVRYSDISDVFHFYKALASKREITKIFNKELLELSIDNGNLLIVLDGIDEVITKAGSKFNVDKFISSIYENYSSGLEKTKIIITCRDFFWDNSTKSKNINTIELKPFDLKLTESFFDAKFTKNTKDYKKALLLADEFALSDNNRIYIPYILDLISNSIQMDKEFGVGSEKLDSNILSPSITNDFLIGRVCEREIIKLQNISIDEQLNLLICLAVEYNGAINFKSLSKLRSSCSSFKECLYDKFKGHPILSTSEETLSFRYDFFTEYFKGLFVTKFFINQKIDTIDNNLIEIFGDYIRYDNSFTEVICKRLIFNDELKLFCIDAINEMDKKELDIFDKQKFSSSILILFLAELRISNKQDNIDNRTELLKELFGYSKIKNLSIINLFAGDCKNHPTFDFNGIELHNCLFDNYEFFWECKMDINTKFINSSFKHLIPRKGVKPKNINRAMFDDDCDITEVEHIVKDYEKEEDEKNNSEKKKLRAIIEYFEQGGTFKDRKISDTRNKFDTLIIDKLINNSIIQEYKNPKKPSMGKQYRIHPNYNDLIKVLEQGGTYIQFERVLKLLKLDTK